MKLANVFTIKYTVLTRVGKMTSLTYHCWESKLITRLQRTICQYVSKIPKIYIWFEPVILLLHILHKDVLTRMFNKASYIRIIWGG